MMRLADFVMSFLEHQGVRDIFVVTGGGAIFLDDALGLNKNIHYYCCHHEQAVAMAAEAYARVKSDLGVSLVTTGPGGTNTITGVCGSWTDSVPHLIISGQVFLNQTIRNTGVRQLGVQEINIIDLVKPVTKYAVMIEDPATIKYHLQKAIYIAKTGRPGPVWIDIENPHRNFSILIHEIFISPGLLDHCFGIIKKIIDLSGRIYHYLGGSQCICGRERNFCYHMRLQ